jgi:WD40 repeat protein
VITKLYELPASAPAEQVVTSVRFAPQGDIVAIGTNEHEIELWDVNTVQRLRTLRGHQVCACMHARVRTHVCDTSVRTQGRVGVLAWHESTLASGARDANVHLHDPRVVSVFVSVGWRREGEGRVRVRALANNCAGTAHHIASQQAYTGRCALRGDRAAYDVVAR